MVMWQDTKLAWVGKEWIGRELPDEELCGKNEEKTRIKGHTRA